jgi:uncharacterized protein
MKISRFAEQHPYRFIAILEAAVVVTYLATGTVAHLLEFPNLAVVGIANLVLTILVIALLTSQKWWKAIGFRLPNRRGDLLYFLVPLIPMTFNLIPGVQFEGVSYVSGVLIVTLLVGFAEETIFRGLMLHALKPQGPWKAALITALIFGLTHALNALAGKSLLDGMLQIFYATVIGFAYAALVIKTDLLWPLVLTHFLTDFAYFVQKPGFEFTSFWQSFIVAGLAVVFTVYGVYLLRRESRLIALPA